MDHQTCAQDHERQAEEQTGVLEALNETDPHPENNAPEGRADIIDLRHVSGHGLVQVVDNDAEVVEVKVPAVETEIHNGGQDASSKNSSLSE